MPLTEAARRKWEEWRATGAYRDFHVGETDATRRTKTAEDSHDAIGALAPDASGVIGAACSTSGRAFELPGRVGDSPPIGPGLYCDPRAGGRGGGGRRGRAS